MIEVKKCNICGEEKSITEFQRHKNGYMRACTACRRTKMITRHLPEVLPEPEIAMVAVPVTHRTSGIIRTAPSRRRETAAPLFKKGDATSPLGSFTSRDLLKELQARGFDGEFSLTTRMRLRDL